MRILYNASIDDMLSHHRLNVEAINPEAKVDAANLTIRFLPSRLFQPRGSTEINYPYPLVVSGTTLDSLGWGILLNLSR